MTMIPSLLAGSLAGTSLAQAKGSDTDRITRESADRIRQNASDRHAEDAAGIGATEEDSATGERDADGRQVLVRRTRDAEAPEEDSVARPGKDPAGERGTLLDLEG